MDQFEATFTDISYWHKNEFYSTGGTRSKYITLEPETNDEYFFKGSKETFDGEIRYPTEFWSEIVSSKIGQFLGFPMLDYNIGYDQNHKQKIGCLSKSMIVSSSNKLTEGKTYLTGFNAQYNPEEDKKDYTFQFICNALNSFSLGSFITNIIEIIVFDSIIGNSDRHQENWGIITIYNIKLEKKLETEVLSRTQERSFYRKIRRLTRRLFIDDNREFEQIIKSNNLEVKFEELHQFAPIYDSGCCLGRERLDEWVENTVKNFNMVETYVKKGASEIHWEGSVEKRKHLELVTLLLKEYPIETKKYILKVKEKYKSDIIEELINTVDQNLPENLINFKLSETRKQLMFKLITLRIQNLIQLL